MPYVNTFETLYSNHSYEYKYIERFNCCYPFTSGEFRSSKHELTSQQPQPLYFPIYTEKQLPPETPQERSIRRSKKIVKDLCFQNFDESSRFLTLTYAGSGCFNRGQFQADIKAMVRRLRAVEEVDIRYVGVFEEHKTGHGLHAHMLINCSFYKNEDFQQWFWRKGFVKLEKIKVKKGEDGLVNVCQYLLKYLTKDISGIKEREPRYFRSRNLREFKTVKGYEVDDEIFELFMRSWQWDGWEKVYEDEYTLEEFDFTKRTIILRKRNIYADEDFFEHSAQKKIDFLEKVLLN